MLDFTEKKKWIKYSEFSYTLHQTCILLSFYITLVHFLEITNAY